MPSSRNIGSGQGLQRNIARDSRGKHGGEMKPAIEPVRYCDKVTSGELGLLDRVIAAADGALGVAQHHAAPAGPARFASGTAAIGHGHGMRVASVDATTSGLPDARHPALPPLRSTVQVGVIHPHEPIEPARRFLDGHHLHGLVLDPPCTSGAQIALGAYQITRPSAEVRG